MQSVKLLLFKLNIQEEIYEELEINEAKPIMEQFNSNEIIFIVDSEHSRVWLWEGKNTSIKMKFLSTQLASKIRDRYGITYTITSIDEGNEPDELKEFLGLK